MNLSTGTSFYKPKFHISGQIPKHMRARIFEIKTVTENVRLWLSSRSV